MSTPVAENPGPEAAAAWRAYQAMSASKDAYFSLLRALDGKYRDGGEPGIAENLKLEQLLDEHDRKVRGFNEAMAAVTDPEARRQLLALLAAAAETETKAGRDDTLQ